MLRFYLLTAFIIVISARSFAQGAAPFWEPLTGPVWQGGFLSMLPDSEVGTTVGGTTYLYLPSSKTWVPWVGPESRVHVAEPAPHYAYTYILSGDTIYAHFLDTAYVSGDYGHTWRVLGTFGTDHTDRSILNILELRSSRVIIENDSSTFYISSDGFHTIDTEHAPEYPESSWNTGDTLWVSSVLGDIYLTSDYGKTWRLFYGLHAANPTQFVQITYTPRVWLMQTYRYDSVHYPHGFGLLYSTNGGIGWEQMTIPFDTTVEDKGIIQLYFVGADTVGHIYLQLSNDTAYRSDDLGRTWVNLFHRVQYVMRGGTLYSGNLISTDYGTTWDTMGWQGVLAVGISSVLTGALTWISTSEGSNYGLSSSSDNGLTWAYLPWTSQSGPSGLLYLSTRPDSANVLMGNTTERIYPSDGQRMLCNYRRQSPYVPLPVGLGVITSGFQVWVLPKVSDDNKVITESGDSGCSFQVYDTITSTPVVGIVETTNDTILAVSSSQIVKGFESAFGFELTFDTLTLESGAHPIGAITRDSTGAIYAAMSDGKLFVTKDGANSWQAFPSPETDSAAPIISLAAAPNGLLFAVDSNHTTSLTATWEYVPASQSWKNITSGLRRQGFPDTAQVTNIWYINGYAYAGTWNMGLFRSLNPVGPVSSVATAEHDTLFGLYPNPASSFVTLTYPSLITGTYRIVDIAGREMQRGIIPPNGGKIMLDVRNLPNGLYEVLPRGLGMGAGGWVPAKLVVEH